MKVTPTMHMENGEQLSKLADLISEEGDGVKVTREYGLVVVGIETFSLNPRNVRIHPDDIGHLIAKLQEAKAEATEIYPDEERTRGFPWLRDEDGNLYEEKES